jgi:hypothetical protein
MHMSLLAVALPCTAVCTTTDAILHIELLYIASYYSVIGGHDIFQEGEVQDWLKELPTDGGPDSVQQAFWKRLNDFVDRYDEHVSVTTHHHTSCSAAARNDVY